MHKIPDSQPILEIAHERSAIALMTPQPAPGRPSIGARARFVKRAMDIVLAATALVLLAPLLAVIAVTIKIDSPGPVLFRQRRVGRHGETFVMLKLRTMIPERRKRNIPAPVERRRVHKTPHDPRVTRVGRILRRTCLDEVPQLWNVLRGDMSIVGPRPELPELVAQYEPWQHQRHLVAPGITGWWQVNRDGTRLMHQSVELDLYYLEHWSVWLDLLIMARTLVIVLRGVGAF